MTAEEERHGWLLWLALAALLVGAVLTCAWAVYVTRVDQAQDQRSLEACERGNLLRARLSELAKTVGRPELAVEQVLCE